MARPLRIEFEGALYHVTSRGDDRRKIFSTKRDYKKFKEYLRDAKEKYRFILHCYVLMSNHYHLLIETPEKNLSRIMHYINSSYTTYTNVKKKRSGHLFQGRFKSIVVDKDSYLLELSRYLHLNPVRAKMVDKPGDYPHSSYKSFISAQGDQLASCETILEMFNGEQKEAKERYRSFVEAESCEATETPLRNVYGGIILGGEQFIKRILGEIAEERLEKEHTSHRKALRSPFEPEEVLSTVCRRYGVTREEAATTPHARFKKICFYLLKKHTAATTREISQLLGGMKYEAAAKMYQRFIREMADDIQLQKEVQEINKLLSNVRG